MAIKKLSEQEPDTLTLEINNGDLNALNEIVKKWDFRDSESALRFALAVLTVTKPGTLLQEKEDKNTAALMPTEKLTIKE